MKKSFTVIIALAVLATCGAAWAADSNTLTVQANVTGTCRFVAATSTLNFGALDPSVGTDVSGSTTASFWCTRGVITAPFTNGPGLHFATGKNQMIDPVSADVIPYTLTLTPDGGTNAGPGSPRTLTIAGNVLGTDYLSKSTGNYSDTVTLTLTP